MKLSTLLAGVSAGALLALAAGGANAQIVTSTPGSDGAPYQQSAAPAALSMSMSDMQERIEELQRQLDFMKQSMAEQTGVIAPIQAGAKATLSNGRPGWATGNGAFTAQLNGVIQFDAGNYYQDSNLPAQITGAARDLNGGTTARRARFGFGGKIFDDIEYNFLYDFGGSGTEDTGRIHDLWIQYNGFLKPLPPARRLHGAVDRPGSQHLFQRSGSSGTRRPC